MPIISASSTANQPLIIAPEDMAKVLDDKDAYGAVYKSTTEEVMFKQAGNSVALSKEELSRYVSDPFWRRLRYGCLLLFWLAWIGLFVLAIALVVISPKCPPKPDREWWQKKICYQIWTRSFKDSNNDGIGDLKGISEKLTQLSTSLRLSAIWPVPILQSRSGSGYDVMNHKAIDPVLGSMENFEELLKNVHAYDMRFIMDIPLSVVSTSHEWFNKSAEKMEDYENYFVWQESPTNGNFQKHTNGRFYRTWGNRSSYAVLNWQHPPVRAAMDDILKFWIEKGVDGFHLGEVQYIQMDASGKPDWDAIHNHVKNLTTFMRRVAKERPILIFTSAGYKYEQDKYGVTIDELKTNLKLNADVDYVISNELVNTDNDCRAECFYDHLDTVVKRHDNGGKNSTPSWPMWELGHPYVSRVASRLGSRDRADLAMMLLMTLPGSVNVYYGDELGMLNTDAPNVKSIDLPRGAMQWNDQRNGGASEADSMAIPVHTDHTTINYNLQTSTDSTFRMFKRLAGLRRSEDAYLYGGMKLGTRNKQLLVFKSAAGLSDIETEYVTVLNFGDAGTFDLLSAASPYGLGLATGQSRVASVVTMTTKLARAQRYKNRDPVELDALELGAEEGVLIRLRVK